MHYKKVAIILDKIFGKKLKTMKQNWTRAEDFDVCFYLIFDL